MTTSTIKPTANAKRGCSGTRSGDTRDRHLLVLAEDLEHAALDGVGVVRRDWPCWVGKTARGSDSRRLIGITARKIRLNCAANELAVYCIRGDGAV